MEILEGKPKGNRLPGGVTGTKALKAMYRLGFEKVRHEGSHVWLRRDRGKTIDHTSLVMHKDIDKKTLKQILDTGKVTVSQFLGVYK